MYDAHLCWQHIYRQRNDILDMYSCGALCRTTLVNALECLHTLEFEEEDKHLSRQCDI